MCIRDRDKASNKGTAKLSMNAYKAARALHGVLRAVDEVGDLLVQRFVAEWDHLEVKARDGILRCV